MKTRSIFKVVLLVGMMGSASVSPATEGVWETRANMPTGRLGLTTSTVNGKIYAIGGGDSIDGTAFRTVEEYDPATDTWTRKADMSMPRFFHCAGVVNGKIYIIGGATGPNLFAPMVEEYDPATDTWQRRSSMPTTRGMLAASVVGDKIYVIGGAADAQTSTSVVEAYDPLSDTWTRKAEMPTARSMLSASAMDGKIYAMGGVQGWIGNPGLSTVEAYDPVTDTWTRKTEMPTARKSLSTLAISGRIYAVGGGTAVYGPAYSTVEEYDPKTDTWVTNPDMFTARWFSSASLADGRVYVVGGSLGDPHVAVSMVAECDLRPLHVGAPEVLVQGSQLHSAFGLYFDSTDRLYIASGFAPELIGMDPETGAIVDRITTDVHAPDDLVVGPDGSLYWTDILTGEIGRCAPDGTITKQFVGIGVNPITFSDDGRLFTAQAILGDALYELDPGLSAPPRLIAENLGMLNGFDFGPDGLLYSPLPFQGQVVRINVDTGQVETVVNEGVMIAAVKFDAQGRLHGQNRLNNELLRIDTETGGLEVVTSLPFGADNLAFDSQDRLFGSESATGSIHEVLEDGTTRTVHAGGMIIAGSVAVLPRTDGGESVYAADGWRLREFDGATGDLRGVYTVGCNPTSVSVDGGQLVLSSWLLGNAVQVWDPQTQQTVEDYPAFARPVDAIRFQGALVVVDLGYGADTARVATVSAEDPNQITTLAEGLDAPRGLAATEDDLWVSDWGSGTVLQLVADGEPLTVPVTVATGLVGPEGIAVGPDGNLLVVETGAGQLSHIDLVSGAVTTLVQGLELGLPGSPAFPPGHIYTGIAVSPAGTIYVASDVNNQLLALPVVDPTLVAHWKLDETEGMIAYDSTGRCNATACGEPLWQPDDGAVRGALAFDGTDDFLATDFVLDPAEGPFSILAWVKGGAPGQAVLSQIDGENWLSADSTSGFLMTELKGAGRGSCALYSETAITTDGDWHRIGLTWDGTNRCLYIDDSVVAEDTQAGRLGSCSGAMNIGCDKSMTPGTFFSGLIDDVRIYRRAVKP